MAKLVCVEYSPTTDEIDTHGETPLSGLIGETLDVYLNNVKKTNIPVRFPVIGQNSLVTLMADRDVTCPYVLQTEGEVLSKESLYRVKSKVPVSLYSRVTDKNLDAILGLNTYYSIYSLAKFKSYLESISKELPHAWLWSIGKDFTKSSASHMFRSIFIEARVYCIGSVFSITGSRKFKGIVVQVIYKPQPTQKMRDAGIFVMRTCVDAHIFANSEENINYIDGIQIQRETSDVSNILNIYGKHITTKQATRTKRFVQHREEVLKARKKREDELKALEKSGEKSGKVVVKKVDNSGDKNKPPTLKDKKERTIYNVVRSRTHHSAYSQFNNGTGE